MGSWYPSTVFSIRWGGGRREKLPFCPAPGAIGAAHCTGPGTCQVKCYAQPAAFTSPGVHDKAQPFSNDIREPHSSPMLGSASRPLFRRPGRCTAHSTSILPTLDTLRGRSYHCSNQPGRQPFSLFQPGEACGTIHPGAQHSKPSRRHSRRRFWQTMLCSQASPNLSSA